MKRVRHSYEEIDRAFMYIGILQRLYFNVESYESLSDEDKNLCLKGINTLYHDDESIKLISERTLIRRREVWLNKLEDDLDKGERYFRRLLWSPNEYVVLNKGLRDIPEESNLNEITGVMILCKDLIHHQRLRRYELNELLEILEERLKR